MNDFELTCHGLCKTYETKNGPITALNDINFQVRDKEFICLVGLSGCGKTTLLKLIAGLLKPSSGQILFFPGLPDHRQRTALMFQEHGLFPWMTVLDNVAFGLEMRGEGKKEREDLSRSFIKKVGLSSFINNYRRNL